MRIFIFIITVFFTLDNSLAAQSYSISGYVKDQSNGNALVGANVFIEGTSIGAAANKDGFYEISNVKAGTYSLKAAYIGYKAFSDSLTLQGEDYNQTLDFSLNYTTIEGNEVVVTAQAKGQMDAINRQLNSKSLVNIISSDRIQELPDANAAETVARVPGVSIRREGGEGNKVVVRGLSPKYNNITVNGVKLASTDNDDRSTDISMISQYMLEGIEVTKAGTPDQDADVLGGTVNFQLKKAKPGLHGNVIAQGMYNGLKNSYDDDKIVFDLSNRFWNDRIGVLAQFDFENRNRSSNEIAIDYDIYGENMITSSPLQLTSFILNDWIRLNDRENRLQVIDINIPNGNISYTNLLSKIDKDLTRYIDNYGPNDNSRGLQSRNGVNKIFILSESLKYQQKIFDKIHIDVMSSFSQANNQYGLSLIHI